VLEGCDVLIVIVGVSLSWKERLAALSWIVVQRVTFCPEKACCLKLSPLGKEIISFHYIII
jgi:hypothetical protein